MIVPIKILRHWKLFRERGDVKRLVESTQLSKRTILKALNVGECSEATFNKISKFFNERINRIEMQNNQVD